jgi:hypothetical protein
MFFRYAAHPLTNATIAGGVHGDLAAFIEIPRDHGCFNAFTHKTHVPPVRIWSCHTGYGQPIIPEIQKSPDRMISRVYPANTADSRPYLNGRPVTRNGVFACPARIRTRCPLFQTASSMPPFQSALS